MPRDRGPSNPAVASLRASPSAAPQSIEAHGQENAPGQGNADDGIRGVLPPARLIPDEEGGDGIRGELPPSRLEPLPENEPPPFYAGMARPRGYVPSVVSARMAAGVVPLSGGFKGSDPGEMVRQQMARSGALRRRFGGGSGPPSFGGRAQ